MCSNSSVSTPAKIQKKETEKEEEEEEKKCKIKAMILNTKEHNHQLFVNESLPDFAVNDVWLT